MSIAQVYEISQIETAAEILDSNDSLAKLETLRARVAADEILYFNLRSLALEFLGEKIGAEKRKAAAKIKAANKPFKLNLKGFVEGPKDPRAILRNPWLHHDGRIVATNGRALITIHAHLAGLVNAGKIVLSLPVNENPQGAPKIEAVYPADRTDFPPIDRFESIACDHKNHECGGACFTCGKKGGVDNQNLVRIHYGDKSARCSRFIL